LGHEGGGIVQEVGPGVTRVRTGDHVVLHWRPAEGLQVQAPIYRWRGKDLNAGWVTTFNQLAVATENRLTVIPKDLDFEIAPILADTLTTGFGIINNDAKVKVGESLVIFGCGGMGLGVVLAARLAGEHPMGAVGLFDRTLTTSLQVGATLTFICA